MMPVRYKKSDDWRNRWWLSALRRSSRPENSTAQAFWGSRSAELLVERHKLQSMMMYQATKSRSGCDCQSRRYCGDKMTPPRAGTLTDSRPPGAGAVYVCPLS